ncbi:MAG: hypothetical protein ABEL76_14525 [Bradymonadaceae bacterium]
MTCEEFTDRVTDYLEGRVPFGERIGMWMHSIICEHCRRYMEQMRRVVELSDELGERDEREVAGPDSEMKGELLEEFSSRREGE